MKHFIKNWPMLIPSHQHLAVLFIAMAVAVGALLIVVSMVGGDTNEAIPPNPSIHATAGPGGAINPAGNIAVKPGAQAAFSIAPSKGHAIADVRVDGKSFGPTDRYTFVNVRQNHTIAATFKDLPAPKYAIRTLLGPGGTISPSGVVMVAEGASQRFDIAPSKGYAIAEVKADGRSFGPTNSYAFVNVRETHTIAVTFKTLPPPKYAIRTIADPGGTITPSGVVMVAEGASQRFDIAPAPGYRVEKVIADGRNWGPSTSYTFGNVRHDGEIHASFVKDAEPTYWTITAHSEPSNTMGLILPKGSIKVKDGDSLTFEFVPKTGFRVQYIVVDQRPPFVDTRYTFTNVHENHTIVAHFVKKKS